MQPTRLRVGIVFFNYGSNGGLRAEVPDIRQWAVRTVLAAKSDPRIEEVLTHDISETPVTMSRNSAVLWAKQNRVDVLVMVDSDQAPDLYLGAEPEAVPFFETAFDFIYQRWGEVPTVIASPYCGPPPHPVHGGTSLVYVFRWVEQGSYHRDVDMKLEAVSRSEAEMLRGIHPAAALPTGLIMFSMDAFDLVGNPVFYYEFEGATPDARGPEASKASTEDVTATRDISLAGWNKFNRDVVFCAWSSWAGHWKPICVGRPVSIKADHVAKCLKDAVLRGTESGDKIVHVKRGSDLPAPKNGVVKINDPIAVPVSKLHRNVQTCNGIPLPVGAGPAQPEAIAKHLMTTDDVAQLDVQVNTSYQELGTLQMHVGLESFRKRDKHFVIVEVGSFAGRSAVAMANGVHPDCKSWEMHCVDHFRGTGTDYTRGIVASLEKKHGPDVLYNAFRKRITDAGLERKIVTHRDSSRNAAKNFIGQKIDVLFLDAGHTYEELKADLEAWLPHMAEDGLIMGHDFRDEFPGVQRAVEETFPTYQTIDSIWLKKLEPADTSVTVEVPNHTFRELVPSLNGAADYATARN